MNVVIIIVRASIDSLPGLCILLPCVYLLFFYFSMGRNTNGKMSNEGMTRLRIGNYQLDKTLGKGMSGK